MAESSPSGSNVFHVKWKCLNPERRNLKRHSKRNAELPKQDCTSPSPIETVCLDSVLGDNASGTSLDSSTTINDLGPLTVRWDRYRLSRRQRRPVVQVEPEEIEKNNFLNELGLGECDEDQKVDQEEEDQEEAEQEIEEEEIDDVEEEEDEEENVSEKEEEETWEDCTEDEGEEGDEDSLSAEEYPEEEDNDINREEHGSETEFDLNPKSYLVKRSSSGTIFRNIKKRKLNADGDGGAPGGSGRTTAASTSDLHGDGAWWKKTALHAESEHQLQAPFEIEDKENSFGTAFEDVLPTEVLSDEACHCMGAGDVGAATTAGIPSGGRNIDNGRGPDNPSATASSASSTNMTDDIYSSGSSMYGGDTAINYNIASSTSTVSTTNMADKKLPRLVIPTKENPPPHLHDWLMTFVGWTNPERLHALNQLIGKCQPTQVRHMMKVIEPQFQRDFISLLPREVALKVLSFLEPRDLFKAAQTCRSWRFLADDNLLWKNKCKQAGIYNLPKKRFSSKSVLGRQSSAWKAAYMRQQAIEMNWRTKPIRPPKMLKGHDDHVITCLQFCGNKIVSGSDDNTLKVWSAVTGKCLRTLVGHTGGVWSSQMSGSTIISGSTDRTLKVWDAESGVCRHTLQGHTSTVRCMHLHGQKVVSGSRDATLRVWNVETGDCLHILVGHQAAVRCVQYDGKLVVSGAYDCLVKVWNPEREECLHTLSGHTNRVYSLQFDGVHVVSGSLDTSIRVWEVETGACKHTLMGHQSLTSGMELRNNILVSGNADSTVKVWDILTGQCLQTLSGANKHNSAVTCLQFNSRFVITSSDDGTVKLWDVRTGDFIRNLVALHSGGSGGVVWRIRANDTKLVCAVGSRNGTEETKLLVLDFEVHSNDGANSGASSSGSVVGTSSSSSSANVGSTDDDDNNCSCSGNDGALETIVIR